MQLTTEQPQASRLRAAVLLRSCALLGLVIAPVALLAAAIANRGFAAESLVSAAVGGGVCWIAAAMGLTATFLGNRCHAPVQGLLMGMMFRMGLPLMAMIVLPNLDGLHAVSAATSTILAVYLVALVVETALSLRMVAQAVPVAKAM